MPRQFRYTYWTVEVEADAFLDKDGACDWAIDHAREKARTWCVPALWTAKVLRTDYYHVIRVCRKTRRH